MSREIPKFRAWVKDLKEYRVVASIHYVLMNKEWTAIPSYVTLYGNKWADKNISRAIQNVVLEQSTGLKDKNGVEICEGDVVSEHNGDIIGKIVRSISGEWCIEWAGIFGGSSVLYDETSMCEVIGTIHENPDLLGGEE